MRERLAWIVATVLVAGGPTTSMAAATHVADGDDADWIGEPAWIAGATRIDRGELIHQDRIYDDRGANTDAIDRLDAPFGAGVNTSSFRNPVEVSPLAGARKVSGDYVYPDAARTGNNAADILEVRVTADAEAVHFLVRLGFLTESETTVVALALDTDFDAATGTRAWPRGADFQGGVGSEIVITTTGARAFLDDYRSGEVVSQELGPGHVGWSAARNVYEVTLPRSIADPGSSRWRLQVGAGLWDRVAERWREVDAALGGLRNDPADDGSPGPVGDTNVYDLAFVDETTISEWQERGQANLLARAGGLPAPTPWGSPAPGSAFGDLHFGLIGKPTTRTEPPPPNGLVVHLLEIPAGSEADLPPGEGVELGGLPARLLPANRYLGRTVAYTVLVPSGYDPDRTDVWPATAELHPTGGTHMSTAYYFGAFSQPGYDPLVDRPVTIEDARAAIDARGRLVFTPLQRGEARTRWKEADTEFDLAYADFLRRYRVDPDRVHVSGVSLGAFAAYKLGFTSPDRFDALYDWIGFTTDLQVPDGVDDASGADYDLVEIAENATALPVFFTHGAIDPRRSVEIPRRLADRLDALGNEFLYLEFADRSHEGMLSLDTIEIYDALAPDGRATTPPRVVFTVDPRTNDNAFFPARIGAYWIEALGATDPSVRASADVTSLARALALPRFATRVSGDVELRGNRVHVRGLFRRTSTTLQATLRALPWTNLGLRFVETTLERPARSNGATVRLENVATVALDLDGMGIALDAPIAFALTAAGPLRVELRGPWLDGRSLRVTAADGADLGTVVANAGRVMLELPDAGVVAGFTLDDG